MIKIIKTNKKNKDFRILIKELDAYLEKTDGEDHVFYKEFNRLDKINNIVVAYKNKFAVGCGAFRKIDIHTVEIKRMYVKKEHRGLGIAKTILTFLESWAQQEKFKYSVLETGDKQQEAIQLYKKAGYLKIPNYGQYAQMENSNCFKKSLV
ncbi:MAG: putative N-acetyltransferase YsnE [Flavobacterium sp. SCGC AAA160-P02]|nr:MAG: putative N-acetyltransferase YsnE [Flavobacterium sp. SCGC AAA160-P02]